MEPGEHTLPGGKSEKTNENSISTQENPFMTVPLMNTPIDIVLKSPEHLVLFDLFHKVSSIDRIQIVGSNQFQEIVNQYPQFRSMVYDPHSCALDSTIILYKEQEPEYLLFQPQLGYNNQLDAIINAAAYSRILGRTLVLPPLLYRDDEIYLGDVFNFETSLDDFGIKFENLDDIEFTTPITRYAVFEGITGFAEVNDRFFKSKNIPISGPSNLRITSRTDQSILLMLNSCTDKYLAFRSMFATFDFFEDTNAQKDFEELKNKIWKLKPNFQIAVENALNSLGDMLCVHVRRTDFTEYCDYLSLQKDKVWLQDFEKHNCYPSDEMIRNHILSIPQVKNVYIATDDPSFLDGFSVRGKMIFGAKDKFSIDSKFLPFLEQQLCIDAKYFIGNIYSTFSQRVYNSRIKGKGYFGKQFIE